MGATPNYPDDATGALADEFARLGRFLANEPDSRLPPDRVVYEPSFAAAAERIVGLLAPGDVVVTMGIGDVHLLCPEILRLLEGAA